MRTDFVQRVNKIICLRIVPTKMQYYTVTDVNKVCPEMLKFYGAIETINFLCL